MTERDDRTAGPTGAPGEGEATPDEAEEKSGRTAGPTPEEVPELLGEQSDYPIAWEPEDRER